MKTSLVIPLNHSSSQASSSPRSRITRGLVVCLLIAGAVTGVAKASPSVFLTFSGGGGVAPVTVSWSAPITYTLNFTSTGYNPFFVFQSIPNIQTAFPVQAFIAGAGPTYTSTGAGSGDGTQTANYINGTGVTWHAVAANDFVFSSTTDTAPTYLTSGDVITLSAGSLVYSAPSNGAYSGTMPTSGYYNTIVVDASYNNLGSGVSSVPEPSTYACFAGVAALSLAVIRRRKIAA